MSIVLGGNWERYLCADEIFDGRIIATSTVSLAYRISIVVNGTEDPSWDGAEVAVTAYVEGLLFNW